MATRTRVVAEAMVALGPERAARLMRSLDEDQIVDIAAEIRSVGELAPERVEQVLRDLATGLGERPKVAGNDTFARNVLSILMDPAQVEAVMDRTNPQSQDFGFIASGDPSLLARMLSKEPAAISALALSSIAAPRAAQILKFLPPEQQADLAMRIATIAPVPDDLFRLVEIDLRDRVAPMTSEAGLKAIPGMDVLVAILGESNRKTEKRVLEAIRAEDEDLAGRIREALFAFEDIAMLDNRAIQEVLKSVDIADLSYALKTADEATQSRFLDNLSERARANLLEEMDFLPQLAAADVRSAQKRIVTTVRELEESGAIVIERGGSDDDGDDDDE